MLFSKIISYVLFSPGLIRTFAIVVLMLNSDALQSKGQFSAFSPNSQIAFPQVDGGVETPPPPPPPVGGVGSYDGGGPSADTLCAIMYEENPVTFIEIVFPIMFVSWPVSSTQSDQIRSDPGIIVSVVL